MKPFILRLHLVLSRITLVFASAIMLMAFRTEAQTDDFNDGNDNGWTRFDLSEAGLPPLAFTFPADLSGGRSYRIYSPAPPLTNAGPARAISYRADFVYADFEVSVDLAAWDPTLHQTFGLLIRGTNIGVGKTTGYIVNYVHLRPGAVGGAFEINRITGEVPVTIAGAGVTLDPTHAYRIVATGSGTHLLAKIFDLADLTLPVAATEATDATYASGYFGLFNFSLITGVAVTNSTSTADVTFDNYSATGSLPTNQPALVLDDFNDATDDGWTHLDLSAAGLTGATYTFPPDSLGGFAYRIFSPAPPIASAGPARAFSYRPDANFTNFTVAVDLIAWNEALNQAFGILARGTNLGLGATSGYVFNVNPHQMPGIPGDWSELQINRVTREGASTIARGVLSVDPTRRYRLVATGFGNYLIAKLYDLANPGAPIATADVVDGTYSSGVVGVFDFSRVAGAQQTNATSAADVTFDNFFAVGSAPSNAPPPLFHGAPQLIDSRALDANPIDDFTDHTYTTNGVAVGSFAQCAITRLFARQIQSVKVEIVAGQADDVGYVGNLLVTPNSEFNPQPGVVGFVGTPVDVTSQVNVSGGQVTLVLRAKELCCLTTGWGSDTLPGRTNARLHWQVQLQPAVTNHPPVARAGISPLFQTSVSDANEAVLSVNGIDATVILDGSASSDPDGDPLQYSWYEGGDLIATGALATHVFAVGAHTIALVVSDGKATAANDITFEVITSAEVATSLLLLLEQSPLPSRSKQPLSISLAAAMNSLERGHSRPAVNQLAAFQNKVRAQIAPKDPALATTLIQATQVLIDSMEGP